MNGTAESGPGPAPFPSTLWSEILAVRDPHDPQFRDRMNRLILRYWRPVYWCLRTRWRRPAEEARDLTQDFFTSVLEGRVVSTVDRERGSFRHYLKQALEFFVVDAARAAYSQKRGGDRARLPIDFGDGECPADLADPSEDPATLFDRAWAHQVMRESVDELLAQLAADGLAREAEAFRTLDLAEPGARSSVRDLAARLGVSKSEIWKSLSEARRLLRAILVRRVSEYVRSESELFAELDELFSG